MSDGSRRKSNFLSGRSSVVDESNSEQARHAIFRLAIDRLILHFVDKHDREPEPIKNLEFNMRAMYVSLF